MEQTAQELLAQADVFFKEEKYADIISLLPDDILDSHKNAVLYAWRGVAHLKLLEYDTSIFYYTKSLAIDDKYAYAYNSRGLAWYDKFDYEKAIDDFNKAITFDDKYADAYNNRGIVWYYKLDYDKAFDDYSKAIAADSKFAMAYNNRGLVWYNRQDFNNAIIDYKRAIAEDPNFTDAYNNLGNALFYKNEFDEAINNYSKAIETNAAYTYGYNNRGLAWFNKNEYDKAIEDYTKAISVSNEKYTGAYYNRATAYYQKGAFDECTDAFKNAISDYNKYIQLTNNPDDYSTKVALAQIKEIEKRINFPWYNLVNVLIDKCKKMLLFQNECITHYTGMSAAKAMILSETGSPFRLSEGTFLNDTSEGRELNTFLDFSSVVKKENSTLAKPFSEKPFIGSFVTDALNDDLTLWRMYGKEDKTEAKGCSITINKNTFLSNLKLKVGSNNDANTNFQFESQFTFYKVAYITREDLVRFIIPGSPDNENELNAIMNQLKDEVRKIDEDPKIEDAQKLSIKELLNGIAYLFKSADYQYEKEVRLVVQGVGFKKIIDPGAMPPKVFIELIDITPVLSRLTLGPKVENADEWAAAFNYKIKQQIKDSAVQIVISHLPFK